MKKLIFHNRQLILLMAILLFNQFNLLAQAHDPHRGLYIDEFATIDNSENLVPAFSILGQTAKEDSLLTYCKENHITYIAIYNLTSVIDNDADSISPKEQLLCNFMQKAKTNFGITQIGAIVGGKNSVALVDSFQHRGITPTPEYIFTNPEKASSFYKNLKFVENAYQQGDSLFEIAEITKRILNIGRFNRIAATCTNSSTFDFINLEFEFWNTNTLADYPSVSGSMAELFKQQAQPIIDKMSDTRELLDSLHPNDTIQTEIYLGYLDRNNNDSSLPPNVMANYLDGNKKSNGDTIRFGRRLLDRILLNYYSTNPNSVYGLSNYYNRHKSFRDSLTNDSSSIHPLLSGITIAQGFSEDHFGLWFPKSNQNNLFTAERILYDNFYNDTLTDLDSAYENKIEPGAAQWFTSSVMVNTVSNPTLINHTRTFYTNSPVYTTLSADTVKFYYSGPLERNVSVKLWLYNGATLEDSIIATTPNYATNGTGLNLGYKVKNIGTYTAKLTLNYGTYSYTYSEKVIVSGNRKIQTFGTTTFCEGGSVILKTEDHLDTAYTYNWYRKLQGASTFTSINGKGKSNYYSPKAAGQYYCRIYTSWLTGTHAKTDTISVSVRPNAALNIAESNFQGGPNITLTANGTDTIGTSYNWNNGLNTRSINCKSYDTYEVIVTQPNGCKQAKKITISPSCSSKGYDFKIINSFDTLASAILPDSLGANDSLILQNNLWIDKNIKFNGTFVLSEPGVKITVDSAKTLTITSATRFVACSNMWRGIEVKNGGKIVIDSNSVIEGAQYGINLLDGSNYRISNCTFNQNYIGLQINGYSHLVYGPKAFNKLKFICTKNTKLQDTLPPAYLGQTPAIGSKSFTGILLQNSNLDLFYKSVDSLNFNHLSNGIVCKNSFLKIENCVFRNIQADSLYDTLMPVNGAGVNVKNEITGAVQLKGFGYYAGKENYNNCAIAISVLGGHADIWGNRGADLNEAVKITTNNNDHYSIYNNVFSVRHIGINLLHCDNSSGISIFADTLNIGESTANATGNIGINVSMLGNTSSDSVLSVAYNVINLNGAAAGIACNTVKQGQLKDNQINITRTGNNVTCNGILLDNCIGTKAVGNTINGNSTTDVLQNGITLMKSDYAKLYCNYTNNTHDGIFATNPCVNLDMRSNTMHNHSNGLHLSTSADIYHQDWRGNRWTGTYSKKGATNENPIQAQINNSQFKVNIADSSGFYDFMPDSIYPAQGWFVIDNSTLNFRCRNLTRGGGGFGEDPGDDEPIEEGEFRMAGPSDSTAAEGDIEVVEYLNEQNYAIDQSLFQKINKYPALKDIQLFDDFYSINESSVIGELETINESKQEILCDQTSLELQVNNLQELLVLKLNQLNLATTEAEIQILAAEAFDLRTQIEMKQNYLKLQKNNDLNALISDNNAISNSTPFQQYEKIVNDIYLNTIAKGIYYFTSLQKQQLFDIAHLCPLAGGKAVYMARSIYAFINSYQNYEDATVCHQAGFERKAELKKEAKNSDANDLNITVSPNPARDYLTINNNCNPIDQINFQLFNSLSEKVIDKVLLTNRIDIRNLNNGIYHYSVFVNGHFVKNGKIVILK
ncbi:MAG: hypothetical protein IPO70_14705 [Bacteroidetes bacterium]|nr:hypothetical protein [Bacteroidota bacterium]